MMWFMMYLLSTWEIIILLLIPFSSVIKLTKGMLNANSNFDYKSKNCNEVLWKTPLLFFDI